MHSNGITHRDIKRANILPTEDCTIKVCDFGVSKDTTVHRTTSTTRKGTLLYAPPEYFDGAHPLTEKSDVWSIGVTLFEMSTGAPTFTDTNVYKPMGKIINTKPSFPKTAVAPLLQQLLEKQPSKRPSLSSLSSLSLNVDADASEITTLRQEAKRGNAASAFLLGRQF
jgi:protein-serine/threonine kinase